MFVSVIFVQLHPYFLAYVEVYLPPHFIMPFYILFFIIIIIIIIIKYIIHKP